MTGIEFVCVLSGACALTATFFRLIDKVERRG